MSNPSIVNYSDNTEPVWGYPNFEPHNGDDLWSAALWDLHNNKSIGTSVTD